MNSELNDQPSVFQWHPAGEWPIYLSVRLSDFDSGLTGFLTSCGFDFLPGLSESDLEKRLAEHHHARHLRLELAGARVQAQIRATREMDRYGAESLVPGQGYRVYRYQGRALMMLSFGAEVWRLGVPKDYGHEPSLATQDKIIMNRYLSWALSPLGVVGFWGKMEGNELHLLRPGEAGGEAVFVDWQAERLLSTGEMITLPPQFGLIREGREHKRESSMTREELFGALTAHVCYLSYEGLSLPVRQVLQAMAKGVVGRKRPVSSIEQEPNPNKEAAS